MLLPLVIKHDEDVHKDLTDTELLDHSDCQCPVSIAFISSFIDFFNYQPVAICSIRHKNETSPDLHLYMGQAKAGNADKVDIIQRLEKRLKGPSSQFKHIDFSVEEKQKLIVEGQKLKRILQLVSNKIHERFPTILSAFRFFDNDHLLSLTLNEFAQGIEYLRIKISFDLVKDIFGYLDYGNTSHISYKEFSLLSEEDLAKADITEFCMAS